MTRRRSSAHDAGDGMPAPGVWPLDAHAEAALRAWAEAHRHRFVEVRVPSNADRRAMLLALGQAFAFPAWYGANLDALYDCLTDLPEQGDARGCVVLVAGLSPRHRQQAVFDVLADAARHLAQHDYELRVFVTFVAPARRD